MAGSGSNDPSPIEWTILPFKKYATFSGRAPRAEYWWFTLATSILGFVMDAIDKAAGDTSAIAGIYNLALLLPALAVTVRRLHDIGRTGAWLFIFVIPFALTIALGFGASLSSSSLNSGYLIATVLGFLAAALVLLVFMVTPGTAGPNDYGPDPYGPDDLEEVFA